ncbi:Hint domain-containing protein [Tritonibacter scottomollicae]|uniref:Hint domain-containing protein n=1 Tax=Tritonibacter scottomollicae TaxID=483013 RepID=UPI003BA9D096
MAIYYNYTQTIFGTQSAVNGSGFTYNVAPPRGAIWSYSGSTTSHVVREEDDNAINYNGDPTNETVSPSQVIGQPGQQTTNIGGTERHAIMDYVFEVSDGTNVYQIGVVDVDLNNDADLNDAGEDGYYLVFIGDVPPPDTPLRSLGIDSNSDAYSHASVGGVLVCFAAGTLIETHMGLTAVERLKAGDQVMTRDAGLQKIRWIGSRTVSAAALVADPKLYPIRIKAGALGNDTPSRDLLVSPQHRVLVRSKIAQRMFGTNEVLAAAKQLLEAKGIDVATDVSDVTYYHFTFDTHQIVTSNGAQTESLYLGPMAVQGISAEAREEIFSIFPQLRARSGFCAPDGARLLLNGRQARSLAARHVKNNKALVL